jgi:hypothetical protein
MHGEWPCCTGPKRGCRAEVPGATFKAKTHPKRQKQIPRRALLVMTSKTRRKAPGPATKSMLRRPGLQRLRRSRGGDGLRQQGTGAFSGCRTLRFQGCGFFMTWPRTRNGARAKGVHGPTLRYEEWGTQKGKETAAGLKSPSKLRASRRYI